MKKLILASAITLALAACGDDSSSPTSSNGSQGTQGTQGAQGQASCTVSTTGNSVTVVQVMPGSGSYTSTATKYDSRYSSIKSEYVYFNDVDAASECARMQEDASEWKDGSMNVRCSGNTIYVESVDEGDLDDYEADFRENCDNFLRRYQSSATSTSTVTSSAEFKCEVTHTDNSVTIVQSYKGEGFEETTTFYPNEDPIGVRKIMFTDPEEAAEECEEEKEEAVYSSNSLYNVECSSNAIVITKRVKDEDYFGLNGYIEYYNAWCKDQERRLKNGEIDRYI